MKQQLLLLEDVDALGRKGEVVTAKPGFVRNFLLPKGLAVIASKNTLRKQEILRAEREKQAIIDRQEAEKLSVQIEGLVLEIKVKVDPDGHMYGSVSASDIAQLFQEQGLPIDKKNIVLARPIKEIGTHKIALRLKEQVSVSCSIHIVPEGGMPAGIEAVTAPISNEEVTNIEEKPI
ncbi:MAG TPA: 50S ribosomal protein L9 [Chlamydiales bacterium]|nr:50S ribosomal protein L9 [Chlamydiales bacterium]